MREARRSARRMMQSVIDTSEMNVESAVAACWRISDNAEQLFFGG